MSVEFKALLKIIREKFPEIKWRLHEEPAIIGSKPYPNHETVYSVRKDDDGHLLYSVYRMDRGKGFTSDSWNLWL